MVDKGTSCLSGAGAVVRILLETEAIHIRPKRPFKLTSGWISPVYVDCRKLISFPKARQLIIGLALELIAERLSSNAPNAIAGGETAGIAYAAWIAERMDLPMVYVRKKPKEFGRNSQIEGVFPEGARVLLVEDLTTDGRSKIAFIKALREAGAIVDDVFSVFHYAILPETPAALKAANVKLHTLASWEDVFDLAEKDKSLINLDDLAIVRSFLSNPATWSKDNSGI